MKEDEYLLTLQQNNHKKFRTYMEKFRDLVISSNENAEEEKKSVEEFKHEPKEYVGLIFEEIIADETDDLKLIPEILLATEPAPENNFQGIQVELSAATEIQEEIVLEHFVERGFQLRKVMEQIT